MSSNLGTNPKRAWTAEQKNAISARGGLIVSAAAGSGKTAVLVERVVEILADEERPVAADRLLIATFSRAAAKELRDRIDKRLAQLIADDAENSLLHRQRELLCKASIGTIDSFCLNLLKDNVSLLDFDGGFRIGDSAEIEIIAEEALENVLEEEYKVAEAGGGEKNGARSADFLRLADMLSVKDDSALRETVKSIYKFIRSFPFPKEWLGEKLCAYTDSDIDRSEWKEVLIDDAYERIMYNAALLRGLADEAEDTELHDYYYGFLLSEAELTEQLAKKLKEAKWDDICALASGMSFSRMPAVKKKDITDSDFKERIQKERGRISTAKTGNSTTALLKNRFFTTKAEFGADIEYLYPVVKRLFELTADFYDELDALKKQRGVLDYSDLELCAIDLLAKKTDRGYVQSELAKKLSEQYDEILLDEYQDTNAIQDMIFKLLSKNASGENEFIVGDVKQSIYGFRKAMPEIFTERKKSAPEFDGEQFPALINLSANFRSRHSVTDFINFIFGRLMSEKTGDVEYGESERLLTRKDYARYDKADAELHVLFLDRLSGADKKNAQAEHTAKTIADMLSDGYLVEGENGLMRPCTASDFCVLFRSAKNVGRYVCALKRYGIGAACESDKGYFEKSEVAVFVNLMRVIDNPLDDVALLSVLMSPAFGFTPDELVMMKSEGRDKSLYAALLCSADKDRHAEEFLNILKQLRKKSAALSALEMVREILDSTDLTAVAGAMKNGARRQANIHGMLEFAARYEETGRRGLSGFVRFLDRLEQSGGVSRAGLKIGDSDAVKLMTIHASKGLEFPVCILAECSKKFNTDDVKGDFLLNRKFGIAAKVIKPDALSKYPTAYYSAVKTAIENDALSEELRVLYVAMTRAKEKLILNCAFDSEKELFKLKSAGLNAPRLAAGAVRSARSYTDWIITASLRHPDADLLRKAAGDSQSGLMFADGGLSVSLYSPRGISEDAGEKFIRTTQADEKLLETLLYRDEFVYPYEADTKLASKLAVTQLAEKTDRARVKLKARPKFLTRSGLTPAERGTIAHKFLQFADFENASGNLEAEIQRLCSEGFLADFEIEALNSENLRSFFSSGLMKRILAADEIYREFGFFDEIPAREVYENPEQSGTILVQGIADCIIKEGESVTVIDYKTDCVKSESELIERYSRQLQIYAGAVKKAFNTDRCELVIYSLHLKKQINL